MDRVFFEALLDADYTLDVGSGSHGKQTGKMLSGIDEMLMKEKEYSAEYSFGWKEMLLPAGISLV